MLCPKCKTATMVKRINGLIVRVCRNKSCANYGKEVKKPPKQSQ